MFEGSGLFYVFLTLSLYLELIGKRKKKCLETQPEERLRSGCSDGFPPNWPSPANEQDGSCGTIQWPIAANPTVPLEILAPDLARRVHTDTHTHTKKKNKNPTNQEFTRSFALI